VVQRTSQELNIQTAAPIMAQQTAVGNATPDPSKFMTNKVFDAPVDTDMGLGTRILQTVLKAGDKMMEQKIQQNRQEAYLDGVAKAGTVKSEEELDASPLMRDWQVAGYRDTMGRITAADTEAQIAADMPKMREVAPEKFAEYLAEKRKALVSSWEGMTMSTRQAMFSQQMLNERAWIKKHQVEHYKFGIESETRSIKSAVDTSLASLESAKSDATAYGTQTDATFGVVYSSIVANPKLPIATKGKLLAEMATYALESDHQKLYSMMHQKAVPMPDGSEKPMSSLMSWDDDVALSKAFRQSEQRTEAFRAADYVDRTAKMEADWANPASPLQPISEVRAHLDEGIQRKLVSADQYQSIMKQYYEKSEKKLVQSNLAQAYIAGDSNEYLRLGKTSDEALEAYVDTLGRKMQLPQVVDNLLTIGNRTGQGNAFRKVGQLMAPAFAQIGNNDKIDPANAVAVSGVLQRIQQAETDGKAGAFHQFLSSFDPEVQAKVTYMRDNLAKGNDPTTAISAATARVLEDAKLTPAVRAELTAAKAKEITAAVADLEPVGIWGKGWLLAKSMLSPTKQGRETASASLTLSTSQGWFENDDRVAQVMASTKLAVAQSMDEVAKANPHMAIGSVRSMALADVSSRSVPTSWGPMIVPKGFSPQRYFGVKDNVGVERIGAALDEFIKPQQGGRIAFSVGVNGELMFQELNDRGRPAAPAHTINPRDVAPMVETQRERVRNEFRLNHGEGVSTTVNGVPLQYNGDNTANADNGWMRRLRDDITTNGTLKIDSNSRLPAQAVSAAMVKETNEAAKVAVRIMGVTGTRSEAAFKLFGSLAFQADLKDKAYDRLVLAVRNKNLESAQKALELTPMYRSVAGNRKQYLMTNLINAMKE
jgi:hypothetical protein